MTFDSMAMAAVAAEVDACAGAQVQQAYQPEAETVVLTLRSQGRNRRLLLSAHARYARAHFLGGSVARWLGGWSGVRENHPTTQPPDHPTTRPPDHPTTPPAFCMLLRKYLKGSYLSEARQVDFDRVLRLRFRFGAGEVTLILEAMGKHSNLILVSAEGTVLDAIKRVGPRESRARSVLPGRPYAPPPTGVKADPAATTADAVAAALAAEPALAPGDALRARFHLSPAALTVALARCARGAAPPDPRCLADALRAVADPTTYAPALVVDARGAPSGVSFLPETPLAPGARRQAVASASEALDACYAYAIANEAFEARRREALRLLADAVRFAERRIREAEEGIEAARGAPDLEREATLIIANAHRIPRGAASATVVDFYDPDQKEIALKLDPALTPREQAERRFKRTRKLVDAVPHLERQREEEQARLERLRAVRARVDAARSMEDLEALGPTMTDTGVFRERRAGGPPAGRPDEGLGVQRRTIGGYEVLLGRNATENDTLTRRIADPDDIWLHARGITSAHVVIRTNKHPEKVPHSVLLEAAKLCALHSQAKHSRLVPVDYTLRKHVVKRRGSAPGAAQYTHEKTLHVEPGLA
ncbi:MAG: NFACT family protein [Armatimonadetes bacterium]|nr:NFACT family protein [Armatimonadota bacterium]